ncbi:MAG: ferritin-like domain-containing protein [Phycisphaerales bacterium]|nr:ferritin-like domain-containing protein [Phycisphaerales bacterium]
MPGLTHSEIIQELNHIFAEETEAAARYLHLASSVRGLDRLLVDRVLRDGLEETIRHAQVIAQKIRSLGGVPRLEISVSCPAQPLSAREALRQALTFEEAALECYQDLLRKVEGDIPLEEFARTQIAVESEHVAQLRELLAD